MRGTQLEPLPSDHHVVDKSRVDGTLLSEMFVQEWTHAVRKWAEKVGEDADSRVSCVTEGRKVVMEVLEDPKNAQKWNIR